MNPQSDDGLLPGLRDVGCSHLGSRLICQMHNPLQTLISGAGHLFYSLDRKTGRIEWHGPGPEQLLGVSKDDFTMQEWQSRVVEHALVDDLEGRDREEAEAAFWRGEISSWAAEFAFLRPDGGIRWVNNHMTPIQDSEGLVVGGVGFLTDIQTRVDRRRALKRAEDTAEGVIRSSPLGIVRFALDTQGQVRLTGWNPAAQTIIGADLAALAEETIDCAFGSFVDSEVLSRVTQVARDGGTWDGSFKMGGAQVERVFEVRAFCPELGKVVCFFSDETESAASAEKLKESEEMFRGLVETIHAGLFALDGSAAITYASPGLASMLEEPVEEVTGRSLLEIVAPEHAPMVDRVLYRTFKGGSEAAEFKALTATGERRWVRAFLQRSAGRQVRVSGVLLDIHDRKKNEASVMATEERMRLMLDAVGGQVAILDAEGRYAYATPQWAAAFGYVSEADLIGRSGFNFLDGEGEAAARQILLQAVTAKDRTPIEGCMTVLTDHGRALYAKFTVVPMLDHPLIDGLVCKMEILEDRTEESAA